MDLKIDAKVLEHLYHIVMQKPFDQGVPFKPQKKAFTGCQISQRLPRKTPEEVGVSSAYLVGFLQELKTTKKLNIHQVVVVKDNAVICECAFAPYRLDVWHVTHSLCKTVTAMAVGILVGDGKLSLDDKLVKIFDSQLNPIAKFKLSKLTVRHLLTMSTGVGVNETLLCAEEDWLKAYFDSTFHFEPGSKFQYNSINSYVLSCIVQELTGKTMFEFLKERLFQPMGIETIQWESCPMGRTKGGWGMYILPEDMAKLGLLLLQQGNWKGTSLIPKDYVSEMTKKQIDTAPEESMYGYGYQTWMGKAPGSFLFNGMLGQNVHVIPDRNMVIVVTSGNEMLFGNCPVNEIIYKYFTQLHIPKPEPGKNAFRYLDAEEKSVRNEFAWWPDMQEKSRISTLFKRRTQTKLPNDAYLLNGKKYQIEKPNVRFQPLFAQFINNSYTKCVNQIGFTLRDGKFCFAFQEGGQENVIAVGFAEPLYSNIMINGEPYLVAAHGVFARDEDGVSVLKLAVAFVEHSNGRILKVFFTDDSNVRIEWNEFPGSGILTQGVSMMMGAMSESVINQLKSHVDLDLILSMADSIMTPVSLGKLAE